MKAKWMVGTLAGAVVFSALLTGGCAKRDGGGGEAAEETAPSAPLPKHFAVLKNLGETDYDRDGFPRYIMNRKDGSVMVAVPETRYVMGSSRGEPNELPRHRVTVGRFYIDLYEANNVQFNRFAEAMENAWVCKPDAGQFLTLAPRGYATFIPVPPSWYFGEQVYKDDPALADELLDSETPTWVCRNWGPAGDPARKSKAAKFKDRSIFVDVNDYVQMDVKYFKEYWKPRVNDNHPARAISFWEAWYYCRWVGKDLPTEAEWELAARGPREERLYPWGNIEPDSQHLLCNYSGSRPSEDGFHYAAPVSSFAAGRSYYGCYNMAGNVWEWCKDYYDATQYSVANFAQGTGHYKEETTMAFSDPAGTSLGANRVIRGGSFTSDIAECRTTIRESAPPNFHGMNIGFRGVLRIR